MLGSNPAFGGLRRLVLKDAALSPKAAEKLFRSPRLQRLIELRIEPSYGTARAEFGRTIEVLADRAVMPELAGGWLSTCGVPEKIIERLAAVRPGVVISQ